MLDESQEGLLRGLMYPIQFTKDPVSGVDRVLNQVVKARAMDATRSEYLDAVRAGLQSSEDLSQLIPQPHSNAVIRGFLKEIRKRLEEESSEEGQGQVAAGS